MRSSIEAKDQGFLRTPFPAGRGRSSSLQPIQHSSENYNPYDDLVANVVGLPVIAIHNTPGISQLVTDILNGKNTTLSSQTRPQQSEAASILERNVINPEGKSFNISMPALFMVSNALVCEQLGMPFISVRQTTFAQTTLPHAPKHTKIKLKSGTKDSGMSAGVIPFDIAKTATVKDGKIIPRADQNEKYRPQLNDDITIMQFGKPLEQIIQGLNKTPAEFLYAENFKEELAKGFLTVKVNSDIPEIGNDVYRINLNKETSNTRIQPLETEKGASQINAPDWWDENRFGSFAQNAKSGYLVEYKKENENEFHPFEVYARNIDGAPHVITGDQDLFVVPRSEKFSLNELDQTLIDTHSEDGLLDLMTKMREVHLKILFEEAKQSGKISDNDGSINLEKMQDYIRTELQDEGKQFLNYLQASQSYLEELGDVTPFIAYTIVKTNAILDELTEKLSDKPELVQELAKHVMVKSTLGIEKLDLNNTKAAQFDLHPAWFTHNPKESCRRTENQLAENKYIPAKNLFRYMQTLEKTPDPEKMISLQRVNWSNAKKGPNIVSSRERGGSIEQPMANLSESFVPQLKLYQEKYPGSEIFIKNNENKIEKFTPDFNLNNIQEIMIATVANNKKMLMHIDNNKITTTSPDKEGLMQIKNLLADTEVIGKYNFMPVANTFTGSLDTAYKKMHDIMTPMSQEEVQVQEEVQQENFIRPRR